jgi:hypothetical protein
MAAARLPGPECASQSAGHLEDGTSCRHWSPLPGPTGGHNAGAAGWQRAEVDKPGNAAAAAPKRPAPRMKPLPPDFAGSGDGQLVSLSLQSDASAALRQQAIDALARAHCMPMDDVVALTYDATLKQEGITENAAVRIGPSAFAGSSGWLALVVFHELLHCPQFKFYTRHGLNLTAADAIAQNRNTLRLLYALDELACWLISELSLDVLALHPAEAAWFASSLTHWKAQLDDEPIAPFVRRGEFVRARLALMARLVH